MTPIASITIELHSQGEVAVLDTAKWLRRRGITGAQPGAAQGPDLKSLLVSVCRLLALSAVAS
jgi:hypothetical protein